MLNPMLEVLRESECPLILPCTAELVDIIGSSVFMLTVSSSSSGASDTIHSQHTNPCYKSVSFSWLITELYSKP